MKAMLRSVACVLVFLVWTVPSAWAQRQLELVPQGHWAYQAAGELLQRGVLSEYLYPEGHFQGAASLSRMEFALAVLQARDAMEPSPSAQQMTEADKSRVVELVVRLANEFAAELSGLSVTPDEVRGAALAWQAGLVDQPPPRDSASERAASRATFRLLDYPHPPTGTDTQQVRVQQPLGTTMLTLFGAARRDPFEGTVGPRALPDPTYSAWRVGAHGELSLPSRNLRAGVSLLGSVAPSRAALWEPAAPLLGTGIAWAKGPLEVETAFLAPLGSSQASTSLPARTRAMGLYGSTGLSSDSALETRITYVLNPTLVASALYSRVGAGFPFASSLGVPPSTHGVGGSLAYRFAEHGQLTGEYGVYSPLAQSGPGLSRAAAQVAYDLHRKLDIALNYEMLFGRGAQLSGNPLTRQGLSFRYRLSDLASLRLYYHVDEFSQMTSPRPAEDLSSTEFVLKF